MLVVGDATCRRPEGLCRPDERCLRFGIFPSRWFLFVHIVVTRICKWFCNPASGLSSIRVELKQSKWRGGSQADSM